MFRKILHTILLVTNVLLALGLVICYLSVYVSPAKFWFPALIGLLYPFLLIANLAFLFYWIFRWRWTFTISLLAIGLGANHLNSFIQLPYGKSTENEKTDLKVLSYNVNLFRLYPWSKKPPAYKNVINFIKKNNFDIVCLQEFYTKANQFSEEQAKEQLGMYSHIRYILKRPQSGYGIAIFSKYPIVNSGDIIFENTFNSCTFADIKVNDDTIRIYNNHLQSLRLKERNFNFLLKNEFRNESNKYDELKDILLRLHDAFDKRAFQVDKVAKHIATCPYPIILCGDFNDSPVSYTYKSLTKRLNDPFKAVGVGFVYTYSGFWHSYRIDYILNSPEFKALNFYSPRINYSDHYPVVTSYVLKHTKSN